jgi:hypothetical protein
MRPRAKSFDDKPKLRPSMNTRASVSETLAWAVMRATCTRTENPLLQSAKPRPSSDRASRISRRAYELAEQRGFATGIELNDWLQAEKDIDSDDKQAAPADPEDAATRCIREIAGYSGDLGNVK